MTADGDGDGMVDDVIEMAEDGSGCWTAVSVDLFQDTGVTQTCWAVLSKAGWL